MYKHYDILRKGTEHPWIWVSEGGVPRDNCMCQTEEMLAHTLCNVANPLRRQLKEMDSGIAREEENKKRKQ